MEGRVREGGRRVEGRAREGGGRVEGRGAKEKEKGRKEGFTLVESCSSSVSKAFYKTLYKIEDCYVRT